MVSFSSREWVGVLKRRYILYEMQDSLVCARNFILSVPIKKKWFGWVIVDVLIRIKAVFPSPIFTGYSSRLLATYTHFSILLFLPLLHTPLLTGKAAYAIPVIIRPQTNTIN